MKKILIFLFLLSPLNSFASEPKLTLYDMSTQIGVVAKKDYLDDAGRIYKVEYFRSAELKIKGPFDKNKLILFETEYKHFNDANQEILMIKHNNTGNTRIICIIEYQDDKIIKRSWFDENGRIYQCNEFKNNEWHTTKY